MEPPWPFHYLPMPDCWPVSDAVLAHDLPQLMVKARPRDGIPHTPHGILQVCLLQTKPFRDCADETVGEVRDLPPRQFFICRNRILLVQDLAKALLDYEALVGDLAQPTEGQAARMKDTLNLIAEVQMKLHLSGGHKRTVAYLRETRKKLSRCFKVVSDGERLRMIPYYAGHYLREMLTECYTAFVQHGPATGYPRVSLCAALFSILESFKLESPARIETGAKRIYDALKVQGCFGHK